MRTLLAADIRRAGVTTPLAILRAAGGALPATEVCSAQPACCRRSGTGFAERAFPDDIYDLSPASTSPISRPDLAGSTGLIAGGRPRLLRAQAAARRYEMKRNVLAYRSQFPI